MLALRRAGAKGDLVYFQPHSAPGVYARAFLEAHHATYDAALDPSLRVANRFGFTRAPYTVIVNKRGEIATRLDATADEARLRAAADATAAAVDGSGDVTITVSPPPEGGGMLTRIGDDNRCAALQPRVCQHVFY